MDEALALKEATESASSVADDSPNLSVVVPVYGCAECLPELYRRLVESLTPLSDAFEILLINDGSPDCAWSEIQQLAAQDSRVVGVNLSRNFSQHRAIFAGIDLVRGEHVVVMDCDLQDKPESIPPLYEKLREGYDIAVGLRSNRSDSYFKQAGSKAFTAVFNYLTDTNLGEDETNFCMFTRPVALNLRRLREQNAYFILNLRWLGFRKGYVRVEHSARESGESSYTLKKLFTLAFDSIISHSNKPLRLMIGFGFILAAGSTGFAIWLIVQYLVFERPVAGWTSVMVSIYFIGGLIFAFMGLLGLYIGKSFDEQKGRPLYVIKEMVNYEIESVDRAETARVFRRRPC